MFCTCSRICSIKHLHVDGGAGGLDVLGLRGQRVGLAVQFLHQKIQTPPGRLLTARSALRTSATWPRSRSISSSTSRRCARIASSCSSRSWSTSADQLRDALEQLRAHARAHLGQPLRDPRRELGQPLAALFQRVAQPRPLAVAEARELRERLVQQPVRRPDHRRDVAGAVAHHAGPAQQIHAPRCAPPGPPGSRSAGRAASTPRAASASTSSVAEAAAGRKCSAHSTLPRRTRSGHGLAESRFRRAKVLRQAAADLEKAVIDGLELPGEQSPRKLPLPAREAGHAANHGVCTRKSAIIGLKSRDTNTRGGF